MDAIGVSDKAQRRRLARADQKPPAGALRAPLACSDVRRHRQRGLGDGLAHATPGTGPVAHHGGVRREFSLVLRGVRG